MKSFGFVVGLLLVFLGNAQDLSFNFHINTRKTEKNLLVGKVNFGENENFVKVSTRFCQKGRVIFIRKEAYDSFQKMARKAKNEGINLIIVSGARSFSHQKRIWERKWTMKKFQAKTPVQKAKKILTYSSMPMTSRHHWGTDIDLNNLNNSYFESGTGKKIYDWLQENAYKFGFCQVYTNKKISGRTGYEMEKWHWSYMPLSEKFLKDYNELIKYSNIKGFQGSEYAKELEIIKNYVNGIYSCK